MKLSDLNKCHGSLMLHVYRNIQWNDADICFQLVQTDIVEFSMK